MAKARAIVVGAGGISGAWFPPLKAEKVDVAAVVDLRKEAAEARIEQNKLRGAVASTNGNFRNDGTLDGSIDALTQSGGGTVTGATNIPAPPKAMPPGSVFATYVAKATPLPFSGDIDNELGPAAVRSGEYVPSKSLEFTLGSVAARVSVESFSGNVKLLHN